MFRVPSETSDLPFTRLAPNDSPAPSVTSWPLPDMSFKTPFVTESIVNQITGSGKSTAHKPPPANSVAKMIFFIAVLL